MTLWFDVEDLIVFFQHDARPTGIQRLSFEVYREVWKLGGASGLVRFCRHGVTQADYIVVDWPKLEADILAASTTALAKPGLETPDPVDAAEPEAAAAEVAEPALPGEQLIAEPAAIAAPARPDLKYLLQRYLFPRLTPMVRMPLELFFRLQQQSFFALRDLFKAVTPMMRMALELFFRLQKQSVSALCDLVKTLTLLAAEPGEPGEPPAKLSEVTIRLSSEPVRFVPEDVFVSIGASWVLPNATPGKYVQQRYGLRFALLVHDLIPELYPEWTSQLGLPLYRAWLQEVVPHADLIFTNSQHTARDLLGRMAEWNRPVPAPVVLPIGHFPLARRRHEISGAPLQNLEKHPFDRPFILFVSTIEVRKNHALLFRVWRRLLADLPAAEIPYLVFAGKTGWLTGDLLVQLENASWLDGHIKFVESPTELELAALYEGCEFTVFPSLYEGWGLPMTESLSFGKTVAASNSSAIPEAGGPFCSYFDPESISDAYQVIRGLIENPERVRQLEARIVAEFRPPSWADTAVALLDHLQADEGKNAEGGIRVAA